LQEDSYDFVLYDYDVGSTMNNDLVLMGQADPIKIEDPEPLCLKYPPFTMLEKLVIYPTLSARFWFEEAHGIDFNKFEEQNLIAFDYVARIHQVLRDPRFERIRVLMEKLVEG
jgi:hypothetical protein